MGFSVAAGGAIVGLAAASPETGINTTNAFSGVTDIDLGVMFSSHVPAIRAMVAVAYLATVAVIARPPREPHRSQPAANRRDKLPRRARSVSSSLEGARMGAGGSHEPAIGHAHGSAGTSNRRRLAIVLVLVATYMVAEVVGGLLTNSLALLADAGHMLSDAGALTLSLFAIWIARKPATARRTYGYYRTEILAALLNGATLVAISIYIFIEAFSRFGEPPHVQGALMLSIATGGLLINLVGLWMLNAGRGESLNVRGAWLHVLTDALGSVGAITAGALIWAFGWNWADPVASVVIGILVLYSSWALMKEAVNVLLEGTPEHIDLGEVEEMIRETVGVQEVHDLHVWTITSGMLSLSAHVVVEGSAYQPETVAKIRERLHERFGIDHSTIQIETNDFREIRSTV